MTAYIALLRAVNLGPHGRLDMSDLKSMCEASGFRNVRTYIASGNVVFESPLSEKAVKAKLERRLLDHAGKPVVVLVRTAAEMAEVLARNPFSNAPPNLTVAIFLDEASPANVADTVSGLVDEEVRAGKREIYVRYGKMGQGRSKLRIPAAKNGTARNMNTVAKLAELAAER